FGGFPGPENRSDLAIRNPDRPRRHAAPREDDHAIREQEVEFGHAFSLYAEGVMARTALSPEAEISLEPLNGEMQREPHRGQHHEKGIDACDIEIGIVLEKKNAEPCLSADELTDDRTQHTQYRRHV